MDTVPYCVLGVLDSNPSLALLFFALHKLRDEAVTKTLTRFRLYIGTMCIKILFFSSLCVPDFLDPPIFDPSPDILALWYFDPLTFLTPLTFKPPWPKDFVFEPSIIHYTFQSAETRFNALIKDEEISNNSLIVVFMKNK